MKKILPFVMIFFVMLEAHQYNVYDMNGKNCGSYNGVLDKNIIARIVKEHHGSILVKKGTYHGDVSKKKLNNNQISALTHQISKNFVINLDSLDKEQWLEVEKNEFVKICINNQAKIWETSLNSSIINDSCLLIQTPIFIGIEALKVFSYNADSIYKINLAVGMKYLDFKNEEVKLGYNTGTAGFRVTTKNESYITKEEDPERIVSISGSYLVDKYPVTN